MNYAVAGHRCAMERVVALAGLPTVATRTGPHGLAVCSGASSNNLNAVVSKRGFVPDWAALEELRTSWNGAPASWLVDEPDEALTRSLVSAGWTPDRTGRWCGRAWSSRGRLDHARALRSGQADPALVVPKTRVRRFTS